MFGQVVPAVADDVAEPVDTAKGPVGHGLADQRPQRLGRVSSWAHTSTAFFGFAVRNRFSR
jgi:hypothetical protein